GKEICGSLENENYFGVQFNPELSGIAGEEVLKNFYNICIAKT
ncbi:MAG: imidazole glycerol phosphate synthase subunit HisH, partial [Ignavibacteriales bacterium]